MMSAWKKVACADRSERSATRTHVTSHHAAHDKGIHNADRWEDGWKRTYANTTECWSDTERWTADTDGKRRAVDGSVLLLYNDLGSSRCCSGLRYLRGRGGVDRRWWRFAIDVGVIANVCKPGLTKGRASGHRW
jgi:hypothetical protein